MPSSQTDHFPPDAQPMGHWSAKLPGTARSYRHLQEGQRYEVVRAFTDFDGKTHPVGERWTFLGYAFLPYEDGLSLFVSPDMQYELHIRLQDRDEEQGALVQALAAHIQPETPASPAK